MHLAIRQQFSIFRADICPRNQLLLETGPFLQGTTRGIAYASHVTTTDNRGIEVPVAHACGHDLHMSICELLERIDQLLKGYLEASSPEQWSGLCSRPT
jgi:hypothetical protein